MTILGTAYVGPASVIGQPGFQHQDLVDLLIDLDENDLRETILGDQFVVLGSAYIGQGTSIGANFRGDAHILIGEDAKIGDGVVVEYAARVYDRVKIGDNTQIGGFVCNDSVIGQDCVIQGSLIHSRTEMPPERAPTIEDGALIGTDAIVVGSVTVGAGCLIAAGAVVTEDTEPGYLYAGVPARRRERREWL